MLPVVLALTLAAGSLVKAYPWGAPVDACTTLNPDGHGPSTATGAAPYKLTLSSDVYSPNQVLKVSLTGTDGAQFKGFLIQGRAGQSTDAVGFFQNADLECQLQCTDAKEGNGLTHLNNTVKSVITTEWKAPSENKGDIVFHFTVVRGGAPSVRIDPADYFMDVKSESLKPKLEDDESRGNEEIVGFMEMEGEKEKEGETREKEELAEKAGKEALKKQEVEELAEIREEQQERRSEQEEELEVLEIEADEGIKEWVLREEEPSDKALVFREDDNIGEDIKVEVME